MTRQPLRDAEPGQPARRSPIERFTAFYGASPFHLFAIAFGFALAGYVISILIHAGHRVEILAWVAGAIVAHDLVLFPCYAAADRLFGAALRRRHSVPLVPWRNHVRAPVVMSAILLIMFFPLVFNLSATDYLRAQGLTTNVYLQRWSIVAGSLFAASAVLYLGRLALALARRRSRTSSSL